MNPSSIGRSTSSAWRLPMMRRLQLVATLAIATLLLSASALRAQTDPNLEQGIKPYAPLHGGEIDAVSLTTGHLTVGIPFYSLSQRGGKLQYDVKILYDNPGFVVQSFCAPPPAHSCTFKAEYTPGSVTSPSVSFVDNLSVWLHTDYQDSGFQDCCGNEILIPIYSLRFPDGSSHQLALTVDGTHYETIDVAGFRVEATPAASDPTQPPGGAITDTAGIRYAGANNVVAEDPNGNQVTRNPSTLALTDTLGRSIPSAPPAPLSGGPTGSCPNLGLPLQSVASASAWNLPGPSTSGGTFPVTLCYANVYVRTSLCGSLPKCGEWSMSQTFLQSIVLPNNTFWAFVYDAADPNNSASIAYGELTKIILPTGGSISYTYSTHETLCLLGPAPTSISVPKLVATRSVDANDGAGPHVWTYAWGNQTDDGTTLQVVNTVTDPLGQRTDHTITGVGHTCSLYETQVQSYDSSGALLKTAQTDYTISADPFAAVPATPLMAGVAPSRTTTTWPTNQQTKSETDYDSGFTYKDPSWVEAVICPWSCVPNNTTYTVTYGRPIAAREYDYGSGAPGSLLRQTLNSYVWQSNANYLQFNLLNLLSSVTVQDGSGAQKAQTTYGYDASSPGLNPSGVTTSFNTAPVNGATRGNQTSVSRWLNTTGGTLTSNVQFNDTGTVYKSTDPGGHVTTSSYSSAFAGAYATQITDALNHSASFNYDFNTGLVTSTTDANGQATTYSYDSMLRIAQVNYADGGQATFAHQETTLPFSATEARKIDPTHNLVTTNVFDGLGRVKQAQLTSDPDGTDYTDTTYDVLGRTATVSNPHRSTSQPTDGVTTNAYDALNRTTQVTAPDGGIITTQYCGNATKVTDPAGKWRRSIADGLGRLIEVDEPNSTTASAGACPAGGDPVWATTYTYDTLNNLSNVVQSGSRQRTFAYDSLSRLTSSSNPESGSVTYTYDADSNVLSKTDGRGITVSYTYDVAHRPTGSTYSNGDTAVSYTYDAAACLGQPACYNIGRRTSMTDAAGSEAWSFDNMGRPLTDQRTTFNGTSNVTKSTLYTYNLDGSVLTLTYPSGRTITYAPGGAGRPLSAVDTANSINYSIGATYAPQGGLASLLLGQSAGFAGVNLSHTYNSRLQPARMRAWSTGGNALDMTYGFNLGASDNGNVVSVTNNLDTTRSQNFTYDQLNRLKTAQTQSTTGANCWGLSFTYDNWANLTAASVTQCTAPMLSIAVDTKNRITAGFSYDLAGNVTADGSFSYTWNAESEMKTAAGVTYTYDGLGNRVSKSNGKLYWYAGSQVLDESDLSGNITNEYVYFGGQRVARRDASGNVYYYVEDILGTSRVLTTSNGTVCYDADFYPFGGERTPIVNTCPQNFKFNGKERDPETGLDDFGARYFSSSFGRWLSPDWSAIPAPVPYADLTNPQTLNLYQFVKDNPETFVDLDGHEGWMLQQACTDCGGFWSGENATNLLTEKEFTAEMVFHPMTSERGSSVSFRIVEVANSQVGSTAYLVSRANGDYGPGTDKCNKLVADTIEKSGAPRPQVNYTGWKRWLSVLFGITRDPTAHEWADPGVKISGWSSPLPLSRAQPGAVIAQEHGSTWGHVGIVVGPGQTVSANTAVRPAGLVTLNNWGFRPAGQNGDGPHDPAPVVRLYNGDR
jgi:RHS repeat-associated protein